MIKIIKYKKGLSIMEILVAFTIFLIALLAVVQLFYYSLSIETNSKMKEIALQNLGILSSYIKTSNIITFNDTSPYLSAPSGLLNPSGTFVNLNAAPLNTIQFVKPNLFERSIQARVVSDINSSTFPTTLGYHRVALFNVTIRWREKGKFQSINFEFSVSRDIIK
ncbi:MAG: hypothetical protein N2485_06605 [bacterium]|nr:hypothetical protein [bacterium]